MASQSLEDLICHEAAHFMTFSGCNSYDDFVLMERVVRNEFIPGVSGYADASADDVETIAEGFVRKKNGEEISHSVKSLLEKYLGVK